MKYAEIIDNVVVSQAFKPNDEWVEIPDDVWPGYIRNGDGSFSRPIPTDNPVTLEPLTRFQFEVILELLGITQTQVFALIDGLPWTDMEKLVARKKVETGGNDGRWSRENPLWDILGPSLGISSEQIDEKWLEAQAL
jgi:hypothetical protein